VLQVERSTLAGRPEVSVHLYHTPGASGVPGSQSSTASTVAERVSPITVSPQLISNAPAQSS